MARYSRRETSAMPAGRSATAVSSGLYRGRDGARSCRPSYGGVLTLAFPPLGPLLVFQQGLSSNARRKNGPHLWQQSLSCFLVRFLRAEWGQRFRRPALDEPAPNRAFGTALDPMRTQWLTAYDATYLELAIRRRLPFASNDKALRSAAHAVGVALLAA